MGKEAGCRVILDTSGQALKEALARDILPYVIKPNQEKLADLLGISVLSIEEIPLLIKKHQMLSKIPLVFVTLGGKGALVKWEEAYYRVKLPEVLVKNPVGSGDATVAGLPMALRRRLSPMESSQTAVSAGTLNAMNERTGWIDRSMWQTIFHEIEIKKEN